MFDHPWQALQRAAERWPDLDALVFPHQQARLRFKQYHDDALALAGALSSRGLKAGDHVALLAENRVEWAVVQLACAAMAAVFVPLNTHYRRDDLVSRVTRTEGTTFSA